VLKLVGFGEVVGRDVAQASQEGYVHDAAAAAAAVGEWRVE
jgi:hypothetical protein